MKSAYVIIQAAKEELEGGPECTLRERVVEGLEQVQGELLSLQKLQTEALQAKFDALFKHKLKHLEDVHRVQLKQRDTRIASLQQRLDRQENVLTQPNSPISESESVVGGRWDQIESLRQDLMNTKNELCQANAKLRMCALDNDQEIRKLKCEHQLELDRLDWEHQQDKNTLEWQHKQAVGSLSPDRERLQSELENTTHRLLESQDEVRQLQLKLSQVAATNSIQLTLAKEHYQDQLSKLRQEVLEYEEKIPVSPSWSSVQHLYGCGCDHGVWVWTCQMLRLCQSAGWPREGLPRL
jgi:hypothetical protein